MCEFEVFRSALRSIGSDALHLRTILSLGRRTVSALLWLWEHHGLFLKRTRNGHLPINILNCVRLLVLSALLRALYGHQNGDRLALQLVFSSTGF